MAIPHPTTRDPIRDLAQRSRGAVLAVALFSAVVNILGLTGSFYMLQVYDRVLASRSVETLLAISMLALGLFALQGFIEIIRGQVMARVGLGIERDLLRPVHDLLLHLPRFGYPPAEVTQPLRDVETIRSFTTSPAPLAFNDLPWAPFYLLFVFVLHPWLGFLALGGMVVLAMLALYSEAWLSRRNPELARASARRFEAAESTRRHVEVLHAMGFSARAASRFYRASGELFEASRAISDMSTTLASISRAIRTILQSAILGLGAYLVIRDQMSGGAIIAASILAGRALQPVDLVIAHWKTFVAARQARARLARLLVSLPHETERLDLPLASTRVTVEDLAVGAPGSRVPIIQGIRFELKAGDAVAIVGASGAGKSTLARALCGAAPVLGGKVRLDGAPLEQWPAASISKLIGYLPQEVTLFEGTIAENIARLDPEAGDEEVIAAAQAANVHDLVLRLPSGYSTPLDAGGTSLSVGQRQRIGLARAVYGAPFFVVLDEPDAHLDTEGERALALALRRIRERGGIVAVVSHRPEVLANVNLVAVMVEGRLAAFGERDRVLRPRQAEAGPGAKGPAAPIVPASAPAEPDRPMSLSVRQVLKATPRAASIEGPGSEPAKGGS